MKIINFPHMNKFINKILILILALAGTFFLLFHHVFLLGSLPVEFFALLLAGCGFLGYLFIHREARFPRTGLELPLTYGAAAVILSLVFSPDPRLGMEKAAWLAGFVVLFYFLLDAFDRGVDRRVPLIAVMMASGFTAMAAVLETYVWYTGWWQAAGSYTAMPPYPYRLVGLLGHPNSYMALVNFCAPLALVAFLKSGRRWVRFGAALWLAFYAISVPFSSSRSGWLGLASWVGVLGLLWLFSDRRWKRISDWARRRAGWVILGGTAGAGAGLFVLYRFFVVFVAHPSHGSLSNPFAGRTSFWISALEIWQSQPVTGAGLGRFMYEYLRVTEAFPPGFWAPHAHNFPFTWLAETGLLGASALLALVGLGGWRLWRWYSTSAANHRVTAAAMLAGLVSFAAQSFFEDFSVISLLTVLTVLFAAWVGSIQSGGVERFSKVPLAVLLIPAMLALGIGGWTVWSGYPFWQGLQAAENQEWGAAAILIEESSQRDPDFVYYHQQAGLAWAQAWKENQQSSSLVRARDHFRRAVELEPAFSLFWANLAVLDAHAGDLDAAVSNIQEAVQRSPKEPSYWLNQGFFLEGLGKEAEAEESYQRALELAPEWSNHPYWQENAFRAALVHFAVDQTETYWQLAQSAAAARQFAEADRLIALSSTAGEGQLAELSSRALLAEAEGQQKEAYNQYTQLENLLGGYYLADDATLSGMYARFHRRAGVDPQVVPGYLALSEDVGQFAALERFYHLRLSTEGCPAASATWEVLQRSLSGGALTPEYSPDCVSSSLESGS